MMTENISGKLRKNKFFQNMADDDLERLAKIGRETEFPARSKVFEEFDRAKDVYIIDSGEISLAICEPEDVCRQIAVVREGDLMGWSSLVGRARLYDSAYTTSKVRAFVFDGAELMKFCAANPSFGFEFMRRVAVVLAERLSATRLQMLELAGVRLPMAPLESD